MTPTDEGLLALAKALDVQLPAFDDFPSSYWDEMIDKVHSLDNEITGLENRVSDLEGELDDNDFNVGVMELVEEFEESCIDTKAGSDDYITLVNKFVRDLKAECE